MPKTLKRVGKLKPKQMELTTAINAFLAKLNQEPPQESIDNTPDGKAKTVTISHVETTLDELFLGLWETTNYTTKLIGNEVVGELQLTVTHPVTGQKINRTGAAGIIIQVNKAPDNIPAESRSRWALDMGNKKANALDLGYPKLKAECLKNAAQSLGKIFGRDLNRKIKDSYQPTIGREITPAIETKAIEMAEKGINIFAGKELFFAIPEALKCKINEIINHPKQITE